MRLKSLITMLAAVGLIANSSPRLEAAGMAKPLAPDNLLFRVQFVGTQALMVNTNAAHLTNLGSLQETAALGTQFIARVATLPARLIAINQTNCHPELLQPIFAEMLRSGFTLELWGDACVVTGFALAGKTGAETAKRWESTWKAAAMNWSTTTKLVVKYSGGRFFVAGSKTDPAAALAAMQKSVVGTEPEAGTVLQGELTSSLLPCAVQRSVYGGFSRLKFTVAPADQSLRIRGIATYAQDLPKLGTSPVVPTNLVTEPAISFTMVREPDAWLEPKSVLHHFLPNPVPNVAWFWGGESSPYQLFMAVPFAGRDEFNTNFGPALLEQLQPLASSMGSGNVVLDTNLNSIRWQDIPFVSPKVNVKESGANHILMFETFPQSDAPPGLTPALIECVSGRTNLVLYDWEYTRMRFDAWICMGQLALFSSGHQQLSGNAPTLKWLRAAQLKLTNGGNTFTEITQTGPRELTLKRSAPLAFTSLELFWLANWLESSNFPAANFLMPIPPPPTDPTTLSTNAPAALKNP